MKDAVAPTSLAGEINIATRAPHANLNRLITSRLALALPPFAEDPSLYTTGLLPFAHVFLTFESLWADLLPPTSPGAGSPPTSPLLSFLLVNPYAEPELFTSPPSPKIISFLQTLRPKGLVRSSRLKQDLQYLSGLHPTDFEVLLAQYPGERVAEFCTHIRKVVGQKPHVLIAYAWCYYMAVFSGGRWIRGELRKAGPEFWRKSGESEAQEKAPVDLEDEGLSFWSFAGTQDGNDIKESFKTRLLAAETLLTSNERVDIIEEAKTIFSLSANLVHELDEKLGTDLEKLDRAHVAQRHTEKLREKVPAVTPKGSQTAATWLRRPEVTGAVIALGCLACVAFFRMAS